MAGRLAVIRLRNAGARSGGRWVQTMNSKADMRDLIDRARRFAKPYRVADGGTFQLKDVDPGDTGGFSDKDRPGARDALKDGVQAIAALQSTLYAQDRWAVLLVFQAIDAGCGAVRHHGDSTARPRYGVTIRSTPTS